MKPQMLLVFGLALLVGVAYADDKDKKNDLNKLKGAWKATSVEAGGMALPDELLDKITFTITGDKYTFKSPDDNGVETVEEGTLKLDAAKKPAQMDINITKGKDEGKKQYGIYELDGDTMKVCFTPPEEERPKDFTTKEGSKNVVMLFKRQK